MPSAVSSVTSDDLNKQKEATALFENFASDATVAAGATPDYQQLMRGCGNGANLSQVFAYVHQFAAVASMAHQFVAAAAAANQQNDSTKSTPNTSPKKTTKKLYSKTTLANNEQKREKLSKCNSNGSSISASSVSLKPLINSNQLVQQDQESEAMINVINTLEFEPSCASDASLFESLTKTNVGEENLEQKNELNNLPKESENSERKRPAAIQELLQMKKARLSHITTSSSTLPSLKLDKNAVKKELYEENAEKLNIDESCDASVLNVNSSNNQFIQQWCNGKEDDTETTSSSGSTSLNSIENNYNSNAFYSNVKSETITPMPNDTTMANRAVADLFASLNGNDVGMQYLKAIQNYPVSKLVNDNSPSAKSNGTYSPPKSSPSLTPNRLPQRTNDNDVCESPLSCLVPHDRIFAHVPGRLSLLSNVVKYKMSVGEVKRRLMGPESFNFSLLGALLRRAKMPEKSQMLVEELNQVGLSIPRGRRRLSQVTLLSALTESESLQFAKDFQRVSEAEFPARPLAELSLQRALSKNTPSALSFLNDVQEEKCKRRFEQLTATLDMAREFVQLLDDDRSPVVDSNAEPIFERNIQDPLSTFSMLTHGFGTPAIRVGVKMFIDFLEGQQQLFKNLNQFC